MGLSNWWRTFEYSVARLWEASAAPMAWAATSTMASSIDVCHISQPPPGGPIRPSEGTTTSSKSILYWVSEATVSCWTRVTPSEVGSTR